MAENDYKPRIRKITLPSGSTYWLRDEYAHERIDSIYNTIAGGVEFIVAWNGNSTPDVSNIPEGVVINYNGTTYTGELEAEGPSQGDPGTVGKFYLIYSGTQTSEANLDRFDEYITVSDGGVYSWEKLGDIQIDLSGVVTSVNLVKEPDNFYYAVSSATKKEVLGSNATFSVSGNIEHTAFTQSKIVATTNSATTSNAAFFSAVSSITSASFVYSASVVTGEKLVTSSIYTVSNTSVAVLSGFTSFASKLATTTIYPISTTASAITGITPSNNYKLVTNTFYPVSGTQASAKMFTASSVATGSDTRKDANTSVLSNTYGNANDYFLKRITVTDEEELVIGSAELDKVSTSNVDVPIKGAAVTYATGSLATTGSGSAVVTGLSFTSTSFAVASANQISVATGALAATDSFGATVVYSTSTQSANVAKLNTTAVTVATGSLSTTGSGSAVVTDVNVSFSSVQAITSITFSTANAITSVTAISGVTLNKVASTSATGVLFVDTITVSSSAFSGTVSVSSKDTVSAITSITFSSSLALTPATTLSVVDGTTYVDGNNEDW